MLKVVRARTSSVAAALLLSLLSLQLPHTADADHDSHGSLVFAHDASTHALRETVPDDGAPPLHCVTCHLARVSRPKCDGLTLPVPAVSSGIRITIEVFTAARPAVVAQPPLRSPPASPVFSIA